MKTMKKLLTVLLALLMVASLLLTAVACGDDVEQPAAENGGSDAGNEPPEKSEAEKVWDTATWKENKEFGTGSKTVYVAVKYQEFSVTFTVKTDAEMLGEPLLAHGLVEGEQGAYGLYIKKVNGILADYDVDQSWWGFYKNGEMMLTGVDMTAFEDGDHFELKYEK